MLLDLVTRYGGLCFFQLYQQFCSSGKLRIKVGFTVVIYWSSFTWSAFVRRPPSSDVRLRPRTAVPVPRPLPLTIESGRYFDPSIDYFRSLIRSSSLTQNSNFRELTLEY